MSEISIEYNQFIQPSSLSGGIPGTIPLSSPIITPYFTIPAQSINFSLPQLYTTRQINLNLNFKLLKYIDLDNKFQVQGSEVTFQNLNTELPLPIWDFNVGINLTSFLRIHYDHSQYMLNNDILNSILPLQDSFGVKVYLYKDKFDKENSLIGW